MSSDNIWARCHVRLSKLIAFRCWYMISPHVRDSFLSQLNLTNFPGPALATNLPSCEIHLLMYARDDIFRKTITTNKSCTRKHVYHQNEQKERGQASHMGCQERVKVPLNILVIKRVKQRKAGRDSVDTLSGSL